LWYKLNVNPLNYRSLSFFIPVFFIAASCGKSLPTIDKIDLEKWRSDKWGCAKDRQQGLLVLTEQKEKLKGLSQDDIVKLLGRPDKNELYKRNQKFFYYYLTPGEKCGIDTATQRLSLRFNAMGFAKEVLIE
jgi:outer membrane protein assembly factor BamE (lipoprotein component of BamABCDE complex)